MNQNYAVPYPMNPYMVPNNMNVPPTNFSSECTCNFDTNELEKRIDNLEKRISFLENSINKTTYNATNYQML